MPNIDERIVQMSFDNAQFESGVSKSMNTLEKLKNALNFDGATKGFEKLEQSSKDVDFSHLESSVDSIADKFTLLGQIGLKAMDKIATSVVNAGEKMVKSISVDQISAGMSKYETKTKSVQTIMNATGKSIDEVNEVLTTLMKYTDETSYDFSTMAATIGKFTSAGVDLEVAEKAMEGIANEAALSGAGIQEANRAMYNFAQSLSAGSVMVRDWMSIENANMATKEFKEELIKTAIAMGTLNTENGKTGVIMKQTKKATKKTAAEFRKTEVNYQTFRETLKEGWLTSDVLINTLARYTKGTGELGDRAFKAAQKALTFTDAMNAIKDAVSSGWMVSFELLFGNLEESIDLWTGFCEAIIDALSRISDWRNELLQVWHDGADGVSGYQMAIESVKNVWETFIGVIDAVSDAFAEIIPPMVGEDLLNITQSIYNATENLKEFLKYIPGVEVEEEVFDTTNLISGLNDSTLVLGDMSSQVGILNKALVEMGYLEKSSVESFWDGYSKDTEKAVKKLQKKLGLEQTGIWDAATKEAAEADGIFEKIVQKKNMIEGLDKDLKLGDANKEVKRLQNAIIAAGGAAEGFVADGIYGEKTQEEIKRIQKDLGVEVTGIWDEATRNAANEQKKFEKIVNTNKIAGLDKDLKAGDANKDVEKLQKALIATGKTSEGFVADGIFGAKTQTEIKKLQKELGVTETGIWDEATRNAAEADGRFNKIEGHMEKVMKYAGETYKTTKYFEHTIDHSQEIELMPEVEKADKDNVKKLQEQLYNAGFTSVGVADGIYGPKTQKAVKQLQAKLGVAQTGIWDKTTRDAAAAQGMFAEIVGETKEVEEVVGESSRAIYALQSVTMAFGSVLGFLSNVWGVVTGAAKHMLEILSPLGNAFLLVVTYVGDLITNTEAEISQSGAFEIALATINAALDTLAPIVNTVATAIENFIKLLYENDVNSLTELFPFLGKIIGDWFKTLREQYPIIDIVIGAIESFRDSITGFFEKVTGFKWKKKLPFLTNIQNAFKSVQKTIDKYIKKIQKRFKGNMFSDDPIQKFIGELRYAWALIKTVWNPDKSFKENLKKVSIAIGLWIESIRKEFPALDFILKIKDAVISVYDAIKGFSFNDEGKFVLFDNIKAKIDEIKTKIGTFFDNLRREYPIIDKIFKAFEWIKEKWDGIISSLTWDSEKSFGENIAANVEIIKTKLIEAFNEIKSKWDNFVKENPILNFIGGVLASIKEFSFDKNGKFVLFDNIKDKIDEAKTAIDNFFNDLRTKYKVIDKILSAFEWLKEKFDDIKASLNWDPEKSFGENIGAAFDLIKQKIGAAFDEIKTKIDNFLKENPKLAKAIEIFTTIKDAITNFFTVDTSDEETTTGKLQKRLEQLQPIIDGIVKFVQSDTFKGILITLGAALLVALAATLVNVGPIIWTALQTGIASLAQNNPLIGSFATKIFNPFATFVGGLFASLFAGTNSFGWDSEKSFGQNITDSLNILKTNIAKILENIRAKIDEFINSPQVQGFIAKVRPIIDFLVETFNAIKNAFVNFFTADTSGEENPFDKLLVRLKSAAKPLIDWFKNVKDKIVGFWNSIFDPAGDESAADKNAKSPSILERLKGILKSLSKTSWVSKGFALVTMFLLYSFGQVIQNISGAIQSFSEGYRLSKGGKKRDYDTLATAILKIAGAIAIISLALVAMSFIKPERISDVITKLAWVLLIISTFAAGMSQINFGDQFKSFGKGMLSMALAVLVFLGAIMAVVGIMTQAQEDPDFARKLPWAIISVLAVLAILGVFGIALNKLGGVGSNGGKGIHPILQMCAGVLILSFALGEVAKTVAAYNYGEKITVFWQAMLALLAMIVVLGGVMAGMALATKNHKKNFKVSGFLKMCLGVMVLSFALSKVAKSLHTNTGPDFSGAAGWLLGFVVALGVIAIILANSTKNLKKSDGSVTKQGGGGFQFLAMAYGVLLLSNALCKVAQSLHTNTGADFSGAAGWLLGFTIAIAAIVGVLGKLAGSGFGIAGQLTGALSFIGIAWSVSDLANNLAQAITSIKNVDPEVIKSFLLGTAALVLGVVVAAALLGMLGPIGTIIATLGLDAVLTVLISFMNSLVSILANLGSALGRFNMTTSDIDLERLESICTAVKDYLIPMLVEFGKDSIGSSENGVTALRSIGTALSSFWRKVEGLVDNIDNIKKLIGIPAVIKAICDIMNSISDTDNARTSLQQVGASLSLFDIYTNDIEYSEERSEQLKAMAQSAKDVSDILLTITDVADVVNNIVSIGSALRLYSNLMRGISVTTSGDKEEFSLESISEQDVGMVLAKSVTSIYDSLKNMKGEEFDAINSNIVLLGGALKTYYLALADIETTNAEGEEIEVDPGTVTKVLDTMMEALPDSETFKKSFEQVKSLVPETEEGVDNLALFSAGVTALGTAIGGYADSVGQLSGKEKEITAANDILKLAKDIWSNFAEGSPVLPDKTVIDNGASFDPASDGMRNLTNFSAGVTALGGAIESYGESLKALTGKESEIEASNGIIAAAASIWGTFSTSDNIPTKDTVDGVSDLREGGQNDISNFAAGIEELGGAIGSYATSISGINILDIWAANLVIGQVQSIWDAVENNTPKPGLADKIKAFITNTPSGDKNTKTGGLYDFSNKMEDLGDAIEYYVGKVSGISSSSTDIKKAEDIIDFVAKINSSLGVKYGGFLQMIIGESDLTRFSLGLEQLGLGVANFYKAITGFDDDSFDGIPKDFEVPEAVKTIASDMAAVNDALPETGGLAGILLGDKSLDKFASTLGNVGKGIYNFYEETKKIPDETELSKGVASLVGIIKDLADASSELVYAPEFDQVAVKVNSIIAGIVDGGYIDTSPFLAVGEDIAGYLSTGIDTTDSDINPADTIKSVLDRAKLRGELHAKGRGWFNIGYYLCKGLSDGILNYAYIPTNSAVEMMNQLKEAAAAAVSVESPSKAFMEMGEYIDDGLIIGLQKYSDRVAGAGGELTEGALGAAEGGLSAISNLLSDDIDTNPTIRPVLDLSEVHAQAGLINGYLGNRTLGLRVNASTNTANHISASEERNQNSRNTSDTTLNNTIRSLNEQVENLGNKITNLKVVMNSGALVGQIVNDMDRALGRRSILGGRLN